MIFNFVHVHLHFWQFRKLHFVLGHSGSRSFDYTKYYTMVIYIFVALYMYTLSCMYNTKIL